MLSIPIFFGSGALSSKMLLVRIIENNKIDAYLGQVRLSKGYLSPAGSGKRLRNGPALAINRKMLPYN